MPDPRDDAESGPRSAGGTPPRAPPSLTGAQRGRRVGDLYRRAFHPTAHRLLDLLGDARVQRLVDVRSVPRSRHNPQYEGDTLAHSLPPAGIAYRHAAALGGFRKPQPGSPNTGWSHPSFRGYADYMASTEFTAALEGLQLEAREHATCVMCAEAQWWRCHRRLIADALVVRGWSVTHLGLGRVPNDHELTSFAVIDGTRITYPPDQQALALD